MAALSKSMGIGAVTNTSARYRARASAAATVQIEYGTASDLTGSTTSSGVSVVSGDDFTGGETLTGLSAATTYYYSVKIDGVRGHASPFPSFRTHPAQGVDANVTIAFGSCQTGPNHATFTAIRGDNPDLFLHLGDFGYTDSTDVGAQRTKYQAQYASLFQSQIVDAMARVHTWDDHCYGANNSHGDLAGKANSLQVFSEYVPSHTYANPGQGIWRSFWLANVQFFMLDTRYQREGVKERFPASSTKTADAGSSGTTLVLKASDSPSGSDNAYNTWYAAVTVSGTTFYRRIVGYVASTRACTLSASVPGLSSSSTYLLRRASMLDMDAIASGQTDWLIAGLNASTAKWKVVVTSVVWNKTATIATDTWGGWDTDQLERKYIQQEVTAANVIVISGDQHRSGIDDGNNSVWSELTSSPLNNGSEPLRGSWTHGQTTGARGYGRIAFTAASATLSLRDSTGADAAGVTTLILGDDTPPEVPPVPVRVPWLRG